MKRLLLLLLFPTLALAQTVPNGGITQGQVWSVPQWTTAWQSKADTASPALTGTPTIGGVAVPTIASPAFTGAITLNGVAVPTVASPAFTGTPTIGGIAIPTYPRTAAEVSASVTPTNYTLQVGNVLRYGADPTGAADSTSAFTNAAAVLPSGGAIIAPNGTYKVSSLITLNSVTIIGEGRGGTTIQTNQATGNVIRLNVASGLRNLQIASSVSRTSGYYVDVEGNGVTVDTVNFTGYYIGVHVGTYGSILPAGVYINNSSFFTPAIVAGGGAIFAENASNLIVSNGVISGPALPGTQPDFGIRVDNGDTILISNENITLHGTALYMPPAAGRNVFATSIVNSLFDSAGTKASGGAANSADLSPTGGSIKDTKISNSWFGLSQGNCGLAVAPTGGGSVDGLQLTGVEFVSNNFNGLLLNGATNVTIVGGQAEGNGAAAIRVVAGTSNFNIIGFAAGNFAGRGPNNSGIQVDAGASNNYQIIANKLDGNTAGALSDGGTGANKIVAFNTPASSNGGVPLTVTTVASLPTCAAGNKGQFYAVSDATAPTYNAALTGGGAVSVPVYCNGSAWTSH